MESNKQKYLDMFNSLDKNQDGVISKGELMDLVQQNNVSASTQKIERFFRRIDVNNDGVLSLDEFLHFMEFYNSDFAQFDFLLDMTSSSIGYAKYIEQIIDVNDLQQENPSGVSLTIKDGEVYPENMRSRFGVHIGNLEQQRISEIVGNPLDKENYIAFKFNVENRGLIIDRFGEYIDALKEFLGQISPELQATVDMVQFEFFDVDDGVLMVLDPSSHPFLESFLEGLKINFEAFKNFNIAINFLLGTETNLFDKNLNWEELVKSNVYFNFSGNSIKPSKVASSNFFKGMIQNLKGKQKADILAFLYLISFKNANVSIDVDAEERKKFLSEFELSGGDENLVLKKFLSEMKNDFESNGFLDFIEQLEFIKEGIKDLKEAECSSVSIIAKLLDNYVVVDFKMELYDIIKDFIELED